MNQNIEKKELEEINAKLDQLLRVNSVNIFSSNAGATSSKPTVCVVGLGYVGLPLAAVCSSKGYEVTGFDIDEAKLKAISEGRSPFHEEFLEKILPTVKFKVTSDPKEINNNDIYIISVPTPVDERNMPILKYLLGASKTVAENMKKGALVILESTVNPGVSRGAILPVFEAAGLESGKDFFIVHCPERINPGKDKISEGYDVTNIPRVIGAIEEEGLQRAKAFYESIISAEILPMESIEEAEAVKILENSFRDINIAFVNELARSFSKLNMNIDITNVIKGASTKPYAFMAHWPSCGVGGHCIPVVPYYLINKAKENGFDHVFLRTARDINDDMANYTVELLQDKLNEVGLPVKGTKVGVLGLSYKADLGDLRVSPALRIIDHVKKLEPELNVFDPFVLNLSTVKSTQELLEKSEALIIATNHQEFKNIPIEEYVRNGIKVIIDGKNCLDKKAIRAAGIIYAGIGR